MKSLNFLLSILFLFTTFIIQAQSPDLINYQAVVRDQSFQPITDQMVILRTSIIRDAPNGTMMYTEIHNVMSNSFGLVNLQLGDGNPVTGNFSNIDWSVADYFLQTELDLSGSGNYLFMGTSQLVSVPFALHSNTASLADEADHAASSDFAATANHATTAGHASTADHATTVQFPDDADADPNNELQTLSINGNNLSISNGNSVTLNSSTVWLSNGNDIFYNQGDVWVGDGQGTLGVKTDPLSTEYISPGYKASVYPFGFSMEKDGILRGDILPERFELLDPNGYINAIMNNEPPFMSVGSQGYSLVGMGIDFQSGAGLVAVGDGLSNDIALLGSVPGYRNNGQLNLFGGTDTKVNLRASEYGSGLLELYGASSNLNILLGMSAGTSDAGWIGLFDRGSTVLEMGTSAQTNAGYFRLGATSYKVHMDVDPRGSGLITTYGDSDDLIVEVTSDLDYPDAGEIGLFGSNGFYNSILGSVIDDPNEGLFATYGNGDMTNLISSDFNGVGAIGTYYQGDLYGLISSFNNAGAFTIYGYNDPMVDLYRNDWGTGEINVFAGQGPIVEIAGSPNGDGFVSVSNIFGETDAFMASGPSGAGGYVGIGEGGFEKVGLATDIGDAGYVYTLGPSGNSNTYLGTSFDSEDVGFVLAYNFGFLMSEMGSFSDGSSGRVRTFSENTSRNCEFTYLNNFPNHGYVAVYDGSNNLETGMYVDAAGLGVVFGDVKNFKMKHPEQEGKEIWYASLEGPEAAAYVRGTSQLVNGKSTVKFPDHFLQVANASNMTIMMTPLSSKSKGLAVVEKSDDGFMVEELWSGKGNYSFDWEVKCVRNGFENYQVVRDESVAMPAKEEISQHNTMRAKANPDRFKQMVQSSRKHDKANIKSHK